MSKKILGDGIEPKCIYCKYSIPTPDASAMLCPKKGVLDVSFCCKKFNYDVLKRIPKAPMPLNAFSAKDFEL